MSKVVNFKKNFQVKTLGELQTIITEFDKDYLFNVSDNEFVGEDFFYYLWDLSLKIQKHNKIEIPYKQIDEPNKQNDDNEHSEYVTIDLFPSLVQHNAHKFYNMFTDEDDKHPFSFELFSGWLLNFMYIVIDSFDDSYENIDPEEFFEVFLEVVLDKLNEYLLVIAEWNEDRIKKERIEKAKKKLSKKKK